MVNKILIGHEAKEKLLKGINTLADVITCTLGPNGRNVLYEENGEVRSTKDGVSLAKSIKKLEDPIENIGAEIIKQASIKSASKAGDGTTTTTLLAQSLIKEGLSSIKNGNNAVQIKRGMDSAVKDIVQFLKTKISKEITSEEQLKQIATISSNNDDVTGNLVALALSEAGKEGVVTIEQSKNGETYFENVEGMQFERGYKSPFFVTNNATMMCTLENPIENPFIMIYDGKITSAKELLPTLENVSQKNAPLLIIAEDIEDEALATLIVNKMRGSLKVCAVKAPEFGERRAQVLEDLAIITGGKVMSLNKGNKLDKMTASDVAKHLGQALTINVGKETTTIIDGKGDPEKIIERANEIKYQLEKAQSNFDIEKLQERLAKLTSGVGIIYAGGSNEIEIKEYKDRVEDALYATKAAMEEGIVPGGGAALLYAREGISWSKDPNVLLGQNIVYKACFSPFFKILENAGYDTDRIYSISSSLKKDMWKGYNILTDKTVDMGDAGIIDPTKVTRIALENAVAVAGTVLTTEAVVYHEQEKQEQTDDAIMG